MALNLLGSGQFLRAVTGGHISPAVTLRRLCGPPHNRLDAGTDLFGSWLVEVTYGRIGAPGRSVRYVVDGEEEARQLVRKTLRRRATAKKRIGVGYRFRELADPWGWVPLPVQ